MPELGHTFPAPAGWPKVYFKFYFFYFRCILKLYFCCWNFGWVAHAWVKPHFPCSSWPAKMKCHQITNYAQPPISIDPNVSQNSICSCFIICSGFKKFSVEFNQRMFNLEAGKARSGARQLASSPLWSLQWNLTSALSNTLHCCTAAHAHGAFNANSVSAAIQCSVLFWCKVCEFNLDGGDALWEAQAHQSPPTKLMYASKA